MIIGLGQIYPFAGAILLVIALMGLRDRTNPRRITTALFWGTYALLFLLGDASRTWFGPNAAHKWVGGIVIGLAVLAGVGGVRAGKHAQPPAEERLGHARELGSRLFVPALLIPLVTVGITLGLKDAVVLGRPVLDPRNLTVCGFGLACVIAFGVALRITRRPALCAIGEGRRLLDAIGWAAILPQMLATLGSVFAAAHVGGAVSRLVALGVPSESRFLLVVAYGVGMALFTVIMGNAFAAFPVMTAGIGIPLLIQRHGAEPAPLVAIGMYCGYCGTLMTPMAANFNLVPAVLLELTDKNGVIKAQIPTAVMLLAANILLMYFIVFR